MHRAKPANYPAIQLFTPFRLLYISAQLSYLSMPLHRLFAPPTLYSDQDRKDIAAAITGIYKQLPPFYVVVLFIDVPATHYFVSGKNEARFLRIGIEHIARHFPK